jgi:putative phosphoribosyl transferase
VIVDDGIATGSTATAACRVARSLGADRVVLAVPVCSPDVARRLRKHVDEMVCVETPEYFSAVGQWYRDFHQVSDREVADLLSRAADDRPADGGERR